MASGSLCSCSRNTSWHELKNDELIEKAEQADYELLLTTDKNVPYQRNLTSRRIAIVVLGNQQRADVRLHIARIAVAVNAAKLGSYTEVHIPHLA